MTDAPSPDRAEKAEAKAERLREALRIAESDLVEEAQKANERRAAYARALTGGDHG